MCILVREMYNREYVQYAHLIQLYTPQFVYFYENKHLIAPYNAFRFANNKVVLLRRKSLQAVT